jgi:hypothetical protein
MKPAVKILIPFVLGAAITGGLWFYIAHGRGDERGALEEELGTCRKVAASANDAKATAVKSAADLTACRRELDGLKASKKTWFCGLPDDKGSACFPGRPECEAQATACREQAYVVCAGDGHCFSDIWGCVKQATAGQTCETRQ